MIARAYFRLVPNMSLTSATVISPRSLMCADILSAISLYAEAAKTTLSLAFTTLPWTASRFSSSASKPESEGGE